MLGMSGGRKLQRRGAKQLKALDATVVKRAEGTMRWMEEDDLRVRKGVLMCRSSERYRGVRLWMALRVRSRILDGPTVVDQKPVELLKNRSDVINGRGSGDDASSKIRD